MDWTVAIGIDTHKHSHVAVALDRQGASLGALELEATEGGVARLVDFARSLGEPAFSIEGTGSYGARLAAGLLAEGFQVYECERPRRPERGRPKSDLIDAERAARRLVSGERLGLPRQASQARERARLLLCERRSCLRALAQARSQLAALRLTSPPANAADAVFGRLERRAEALGAELAEVDRELKEITRALCPRLLEEPGVGPLCAAQLVVSAGDPRRLRSEAAFAALAGVSPVEASSGLIRRHRLNRGGDRQLNWVLYMSALSRIRYHSETQVYYERLLARGKSKREAIRCLKRMLTRRLYRLLVTNEALYRA